MTEDIEYRKMIKEMLDTEDAGFTTWEIEFLDDNYKKTSYSPKVKAIIEKLYKQKM